MQRVPTKHAVIQFSRKGFGVISYYVKGTWGAQEGGSPLQTNGLSSGFTAFIARLAGQHSRLFPLSRITASETEANISSGSHVIWLDLKVLFSSLQAVSLSFLRMGTRETNTHVQDCWNVCLILHASVWDNWCARNERHEFPWSQGSICIMHNEPWASVNYVNLYICTHMQVMSTLKSWTPMKEPIETCYLGVILFQTCTILATIKSISHVCQWLEVLEQSLSQGS